MRDKLRLSYCQALLQVVPSIITNEGLVAESLLCNDFMWYGNAGSKQNIWCWFELYFLSSEFDVLTVPHNQFSWVDSSVSIVTRLRVGRQAFGFPAGTEKGFLHFAAASWPPLMQWVPWPVPVELKRPWREADHSPPPSAKVKNAWRYTKVYPKVSGLAAWSENCEWCRSLLLGAVVSHFVTQSSEFFRHNHLCWFSTSVYYYKRIFRYRLSPETFGSTLVIPRILIRGTIWRWATRFTTQTLNPRRSSFWYPPRTKLGLPQKWSGRSGKGRNPAPAWNRVLISQSIAYPL